LNSSKPRIYSILVTNFQDYEEKTDYSDAKENFWAVHELEKEVINEKMTYIQRIGAWKAMSNDDEKELRILLEQKKPERALIGKAIKIVRTMADRPTSNSVIGKNLIVVVVPRDLNKSCKALIKYENKRDVFVGANQITLLGPEDSSMIKDVKLTKQK